MGFTDSQVDLFEFKMDSTDGFTLPTSKAQGLGAMVMEVVDSELYTVGSRRSG